MSDKKVVSHKELKDAIANKYPSTHWVVLKEIGDVSGYDRTRSIDAVAFGLYSSRGFEVHAFECKAHRSDWLKEVRSPEKADFFANIADKFWIVAGKDVVKKEELPQGWGLIVVSRKGMGFRSKISAQAAYHLGGTDRDLPRTFVAAMLTRMKKAIESFEESFEKDYVSRSGIKKELDASYDRGFHAGVRSEGNHARALESLREQVAVFQELSGIELNGYNGKRLGDEVALVRALQDSGMFYDVVRRGGALATRLRDFAKEIESNIDVFKEDVSNGFGKASDEGSDE